jgi:energy-coupling factor transport system permease protein
MTGLRAQRRRALLHPFAVSVLPLPAVLSVLLASRPWCALLALLFCLLLAAGRSAWMGLAAAAVGAVTFGILWTGMGLWLPREAATLGALRILATSALLVVPALFVDARVLAETLIDRFRVPYRVLDAAMLGGRFVALLRADLRIASAMAALRSRGDLRRLLHLHVQMVPAVLVASFRHSEQLAIAMDSRGFGQHPRRTVRCSRPVTRVDVGVLAGVWCLSVVLAVLLEGR